MHSPHPSDAQLNRDLVIRRLYNRLISLCVVGFVVCLTITLVACGSGSIESPAVETTENESPENGLSEAETPVQTTGDQGSGDQVATAQPTSTTSPADDHSSPENTTIHFTDSNEDIWPPQPVNVTSITTLPIVAVAQTAPDKVAKSTQTLLADSRVRKSLGDHFAVLTEYEIKNKTKVGAHIETKMYNYATDQVITTRFSTGNNTVVSHEATEAFRYQPPESRVEVLQAIELAKDALSLQGFTDHLELRGTGLLAYPSAIETAESGHQFFAERKIYVTFGDGNGELPQYRALVNLSDSTVESSGAIQ